MNEQDPLAKSKWNYAAIVSLLILLSVNVVAAIALFNYLISWTDWLAATGPINGIALGWVSRTISSSITQ